MPFARQASEWMFPAESKRSWTYDKRELVTLRKTLIFDTWLSSRNFIKYEWTKFQIFMEGVKTREIPASVVSSGAFPDTLRFPDPDATYPKPSVRAENPWDRRALRFRALTD